MGDLKTLVEDQKQAALNVFIGEQAHRKANIELNDKLKQKKLILKNGVLEPQREHVAAVSISEIDNDALLRQAANVKKNPLDPII